MIGVIATLAIFAFTAGLAVGACARDWLCDELPAWDDDHRSVVEFHATRTALQGAERGEWN